MVSSGTPARRDAKLGLRQPGQFNTNSVAHKAAPSVARVVSRTACGLPLSVLPANTESILLSMSPSRRPLLLALLASVLAHGLLVLSTAGAFVPRVEVAPPPVRVVLNHPRLANAPGATSISVAPVPKASPDVRSNPRRQSPRTAATAKPAAAVPSPPVQTAPATPLQSIQTDQPVVRAESPVSVAEASGESAGSGGGAVQTSSVGKNVGSPSVKRDASPGAGGNLAVDGEERGRYRQALKAAAQRFRRYPALARERGWEGTASVALVFDGGEPMPEMSIVSSSGRELLDEQALAMLTQAVRAAPMPEALKGQKFRIELPVTFSLADE